MLIPIDIVKSCNIVENPPSMWGKTPEQLVQSLEMEGATLTLKPPQGSGKVIVYEVRYGDRTRPAVTPTGIKEIEYHSGGGTHTPDRNSVRSPYYKIELNNGTQVRSEYMNEK